MSRLARATLTRLAALGTLSRTAGEGGPSPPGLVGEGSGSATFQRLTGLSG